MNKPERIYVEPRRFAEVWEFNRRGLPYCGTIEQQMRVRSWFNRRLLHGTPFHKVMQALDRKANYMGQNFYQFTFEDDPQFNNWANSTRVRILFYNDPDNVPSQDWFDYVIPHELGHVVGWNLLNPVDKSEEWADEFRIWILNGSLTHIGSTPDPTWQRMGPGLHEFGVI